MISRSPRLTLSLLAAVLAALGPSCTEALESRRPDVYLIVVDTLRADRLGCYGYPRETSPFIDGLAANGALFLDASAQSSWTKPSMVSLMSGRYVTRYVESMPESMPHLAETFRDNGYATFGAVGNVLLSDDLGFARGFEQYDSRELDEEELAARAAAGLLPTPCRSLDALTAVMDGWLDEEFARRDAGEHRPILAYLHPMDPHDPYDPHPGLAKSLGPPVDQDTLPTPWHLEALREWGRAEDADGTPTAWAPLNTDRERYDREVRSTDDELARFFERLEREGRLENAVIAIVADHGEALYDHSNCGRVEHQPDATLQRTFQRGHGRVLTAPLIATPFVLSGAGVPSGLMVDDPVENIDLFPTLLELCEIDRPDGLHGRSLASILEGVPAPWRRDLHAFTLYSTAVRERTTGLKLTLTSEAGDQIGSVPTLYDLERDPLERENLFDARPDDVERLSERIRKWQDSFPTASGSLPESDAEHLRHMRALGYIGND